MVFCMLSARPLLPLVGSDQTSLSTLKPPPYPSLLFPLHLRAPHPVRILFITYSLEMYTLKKQINK